MSTRRGIFDAGQRRHICGARHDPMVVDRSMLYLLSLELAKPAQRDGGLRIVGFVATVKRAYFYSLKSGAFD